LNAGLLAHHANRLLRHVKSGLGVAEHGSEALRLLVLLLDHVFELVQVRLEAEEKRTQFFTDRGRCGA
jgi:hypothetical protein